MERLNITLDDEQAEELTRLAERMYVQPGTVARSLLSSALDYVGPGCAERGGVAGWDPRGARARAARSQAGASW